MGINFHTHILTIIKFVLHLTHLPLLLSEVESTHGSASITKTLFQLIHL